MMKIRQRKSWFALLAMWLLFAACKGESPTAPPVTPGGGPTTPPVGATVTLTVSNANPLVNSTTVITATVTQNNQPVANGTAVEFSTTLGTFTDTGTAITIRTTTNGVTTATLTSSSAGTATITAVVNNVTKTTKVTFQAQPVTPPPVSTTPTISSISPTFGRPQGGETVTIIGTNFRSPVRVLFDFGTGVTPKEALVVPNSVTSTRIQVITPAVDLGTGQTKTATIVVFVDVGSPNEESAKSPTFTYQLEKLTPVIKAVSPASGPINGGTRVTIFGEAFQAPVQVFFGLAEAQIITVTFTEITVLSPAARDTSPSGSGTVTGPVDVRVINITSNTSVTLLAAFRYTPKMQITAAGPTEGPFTGGTRVTIDGIGFDDPVAVVIGGLAAQPIRVTGTEIIALTSAVILKACGDVTGPISVTNVDNGDSATGPIFTYRVPKPTIIGVTPATQTAGMNVTVTVLNAPPGTNKFTIADKTVFPSSTTVNADGTTSFVVPLPTNFTFTTATCTTTSGGTGTQPQPLTVDVTFTNVQSTCTDTAKNALTINPTSAACTAPPTAVLSTTSLAFGSVPAGTTSAPQTFTISNTGTQNLSLGAPSVTATNATITVTPNTSRTVTGGGAVTYSVTIRPTAAGAVTGTITLSSNDPTKPSISVTVSGTGT